MMNAGKRFTKGRPKNHLSDEDIDYLAGIWAKGEDVEGELKSIEVAEITASDYNLSPDKWVIQVDDTVRRPIAEIMADLLKLDDEARAIDSKVAELVSDL